MELTTDPVLDLTPHSFPGDSNILEGLAVSSQDVHGATSGMRSGKAATESVPPARKPTWLEPFGVRSGRVSGPRQKIFVARLIAQTPPHVG